MAFEFDDHEIDQTSDENTEVQGPYYSPDPDYGRLGDCNVTEGDMPDAVSKQTGMSMGVKTMSFPDSDAMIEIVAKTCTAEFHKHKGYIDCAEESAITLYQLERLFGLPDEHDPLNPTHTFRNHFISETNKHILDEQCLALFELDEIFILINQMDVENPFTITKEGWKSPSPTHKWGVIYVLNRKATEEWIAENQHLASCSTMIDRIYSKPVVVFKAKSSIKRGNLDFKAREIYSILKEKSHEFPVILQFKGVYKVDDVTDNEMLPLRKVNGRFTLNN